MQYIGKMIIRRPMTRHSNFKKTIIISSKSIYSFVCVRKLYKFPFYIRIIILLFFFFCTIKQAIIIKNRCKTIYVYDFFFIILPKINLL